VPGGGPDVVATTTTSGGGGGAGGGGAGGAAGGGTAGRIDHHREDERRRLGDRRARIAREQAVSRGAFEHRRQLEGPRARGRRIDDRRRFEVLGERAHEVGEARLDVRRRGTRRRRAPHEREISRWLGRKILRARHGRSAERERARDDSDRAPTAPGVHAARIDARAQGRHGFRSPRSLRLRWAKRRASAGRSPSCSRSW
jgi:hypothetical protein